MLANRPIKILDSTQHLEINHQHNQQCNLINNPGKIACIKNNEKVNCYRKLLISLMLSLFSQISH